MDDLFDYYRLPVNAPENGGANHIPVGLGTERKLMRAVGTALHFPPYYGENFDAFWDCVRDMAMPRKGICLVHADLPPLPAEQASVYVELLRDAVRFWQVEGKKRLSVWFPLACRPAVERILRQLPNSDA